MCIVNVAKCVHLCVANLVWMKAAFCGGCWKLNSVLRPMRRETLSNEKRGDKEGEMERRGNEE